jgi:hypothetical protein
MLSMTSEQAFQAMVLFLERHYERTKSDDIGALLGDLQLLEDGDTADPAALSEWTECVHAARNLVQGSHGAKKS